MTQHNGYDFGKAFEPDIAILLATTSDELGSVLRAHFCLEEFLDVWCNTMMCAEKTGGFNLVN
ncbi:hypothetical protein [Acinetobacter baumannii]|uniref:hypothetical protein n=1 Tax=Acinetobacter baumannii TaxID=470 RepID=UPI003FA43DE5